MFLQLEQNTPEIYNEKSRDFQLLCRIINIYLNALIEQSNKIVYNTDTDTLDERLLYLRARKLGFTTHKYFPPTILRNICENFPSLIRRKGTRQSILDAVYTILSANNLVTLLSIGEDNQADPYLINIISNVGDEEIEYISELLSFIIPAGVLWTYTAGVNQEIPYKLTPELVDAVVRFRGIGNTVARIMRSPFDNNNLTVTSRGVDWNYFIDTKKHSDYTYITAWGGNPTIPNKEGGEDTGDATVQPFYSKINIVKVISSNTETQKTEGGIAIDAIGGFDDKTAATRTDGNGIKQVEGS